MQPTPVPSCNACGKTSIAVSKIACISFRSCSRSSEQEHCPSFSLVHWVGSHLPADLRGPLPINPQTPGRVPRVGFLSRLSDRTIPREGIYFEGGEVCPRPPAAVR